MEDLRSRTAPRWRHAWLLAFVPLAFNALTGPYLAWAGETQENFEASTGADYATFAATYPEVLRTMDNQERVLGVLLTAFSLMGAILAWTHRRGPDAAAWAALWVAPAGFAGVAAAMTYGGAGGLAAYYWGCAAAAAVGVALMRPRLS